MFVIFFACIFIRDLEFKNLLFAGHIRKVTGSFDLAFYIAGILAVAAGACMLLIPIIHYWFPNTATSRHRSLSLDVDS